MQIQTPVGNRNNRKNIFVGEKKKDEPCDRVPNTDRRNYNRNDRYASSVPKKETNNKFETFHNFKRQELIKEEEEKKKKAQNKQIKEKKEENVTTLQFQSHIMLQEILLFYQFQK